MRPLALSWEADDSVPISLELVKSQLRIDHDEFDELIFDLHLPAAVEWAEGEMHRSILSKEHQWVISDFPRGKDLGIRLPRGKTQSVASITYATSTTNTITLTGPTSGSPGTGYREELRGDGGGTLYPLTDWPDVDLDASAPVVITFNAGWTAARVPADIKLALAMYVADAIEITGAADLSAHSDITVKNILLSSWKLHRWY